jgi:carbohydrate-binding DOMON domain-containing protein
MSTQYRLVQSGKTASGGCSAGQGSSEPVVPRIYFYSNSERLAGTNSGDLKQLKHGKTRTYMSLQWFQEIYLTFYTVVKPS